MSQTLKPFRVSYYLENEIRLDGRVELQTFSTYAKDTEEAKGYLRSSYLDRPDLVVLNAYEDHHVARIISRRRRYTVKPTVRQQTQGYKNLSTASNDTRLYPATLGLLMTTPRMFDYSGVTPFTGEIIRPAGPCKWHPDAKLDADGRCLALDFLQYTNRFDPSLMADRRSAVMEKAEEMPALAKCPWHPSTTLDGLGLCHAPDPSEPRPKDNTAFFSSTSLAPLWGTLVDKSQPGAEDQTPDMRSVRDQIEEAQYVIPDLEKDPSWGRAEPQEPPCVSQEVKDQVYADCESNKRFIEQEPVNLSFQVATPEEVKEEGAAFDGAVAQVDSELKKRGFWDDPFTYTFIVPAAAFILYSLIRVIFKH